MLEHRDLLKKIKLLTLGTESEIINRLLVCRNTQGAKPRLEWQADEFMGNFLMPAAMVQTFLRDHWKWCFDSTNLGWRQMAELMARNFRVNRLTAAVRLARLGYIQDVGEAGCWVKSLREWEEIKNLKRKA